MGLLRKLKDPISGVDFCSNDYLGLANSEEVHSELKSHIRTDQKNGATGSRLLSGNFLDITKLENKIADFHGSQSALLFPSGYQANVGLLQCIAQKGDTIILDELCHASLIDGARLSYAHRFKFQHNDLDDLKSKLLKAKGHIYIVIESVYSMDGDLADLEGIIQLSKEFNAHIIVDEAHTGGIYGKGKGLVSELNQEINVFARVITYGKTFGTHGAAILGTKTLKDYLVNFSRSFIYSTGIPPIHVLAIDVSYAFIKKCDPQRQCLFDNIQYFKSKMQSVGHWINSDTAIQSLIVPGNTSVKQLSHTLNDNGFAVFPILSPTVPTNTERIRFCLHSYNTFAQIDDLFKILNRS